MLTDVDTTVAPRIGNYRILMNGSTFAFLKSEANRTVCWAYQMERIRVDELDAIIERAVEMGLTPEQVNFLTVGEAYFLGLVCTQTIERIKARWAFHADLMPEKFDPENSHVDTRR